MKLVIEGNTVNLTAEIDRETAIKIVSMLFEEKKIQTRQEKTEQTRTKYKRVFGKKARQKLERLIDIVMAKRNSAKLKVFESECKKVGRKALSGYDKKMIQQIAKKNGYVVERVGRDIIVRKPDTTKTEKKNNYIVTGKDVRSLIFSNALPPRFSVFDILKAFKLKDEYYFHIYGTLSRLVKKGIIEKFIYKTQSGKRVFYSLKEKQKKEPTLPHLKKLKK